MTEPSQSARIVQLVATRDSDDDPMLVALDEEGQLWGAVLTDPPHEQDWYRIKGPPATRRTPAEGG
jgi:hypothetical protein